MFDIAMIFIGYGIKRKREDGKTGKRENGKTD
jgi:hypothetical protein